MEENNIPDNKDKENHFKEFGKKLKRIEDNAKQEAQSTLTKGVEKLSSSRFLPEDMSNYLLSLKQHSNLPESILPSLLFKKPTFRGKEDYFSRLASELIIFGLSYQRVYLRPIHLSEIAHSFHKHKPWWHCDIQDIEKSLRLLIDEKIVKNTQNGLLFEPLTLSEDIQEFLKIISPHISPHGEISFEKIYSSTIMSKEKIRNLLTTLESNNLCIIDHKENKLYFPDYFKEE